MAALIIIVKNSIEYHAMNNHWVKSENFEVVSADGERIRIRKTSTVDAIHDQPRVVYVALGPKVEWSVTALGENRFRIGRKAFRSVR
jgi:hypothetical protein